MKNYEPLCVLRHKGGKLQEQSYKRAGVCKFSGGKDCIICSLGFPKSKTRL